MSNNDQWMSSREAQAYIGRTDRQLRRYAERGRVRTRTSAGRVQYHRGDLDQVRAELPPDDRPKGPETQIVPAGELAEMVRELQREIAAAAAREGFLRGQLEQRPRLEDQQALQAQIAEERINRQLAERQLSDMQSRLDRSEQRRQVVTIIAVVALTLLIAALFWYFGLR
jgi:hypothetical protein